MTGHIDGITTFRYFKGLASNWDAEKSAYTLTMPMIIGVL